MAPTPGLQIAKKFYPYVWQGINRKGQKVSGEMQGENPNQVKAELRKQGVNVSKIHRVELRCHTAVTKYSGAIKLMDIAMTSRQITTMLSAGVPWCHLYNIQRILLIFCINFINQVLD